MEFLIGEVHGRDLHDGVQQRFVSLALHIRRAEADVPPELTQLRQHLSAVVARLDGTVDDVRELSRGVPPAILTGGGLRPALRTLARRCAVLVELDVQEDGRLPDRSRSPPAMWRRVERVPLVRPFPFAGAARPCAVHLVAPRIPTRSAACGKAMGWFDRLSDPCRSTASGPWSSRQSQ
ncbi:histidine kinase [Dactylosporangium salmoneum]|uniref:histidine kinase n=1 Tax=Dactylosporangium salmoneum TaxID=53361 RepID=UPI0031D24BA8